MTLDGEVTTIEPDAVGDVCGHGTACAGIVRSLAPACRIHSVRVLGEGNTGSADLILGGLRHAIEQRFEVVNLSLSTTKRKFAELLHELADAAYFSGTVLVASAHNMPVESYPWRFSSVISVGSHEGDDSLEWYANPNPPVEFFARGVDLDVAWFGGSTLRATGNSFAAPHIAALSALVLSKHPGLTPFQLKSVLYLTAIERRRNADDRRLELPGGRRDRDAPVGGEPSRAAAVDRGRRACDLRRQGVVDLPARRRRPTSSSSRPSPARARAT